MNRKTRRMVERLLAESVDVKDTTLVGLLKAQASEVGSPYALYVVSQCESFMEGDLTAVAHLDAPVISEYDNAYAAARDWQLYHWLRKYPFDGVGDDVRRATAEQSAADAEEQCRETNKRIGSWLSGATRAPSTRTQACFLRAREKIHKLLDDDSFSTSDWLVNCRFGPGTVLSGVGTSDVDKLRSPLGFTPELMPFIPTLKREFEVWCDSIGYTPGGARSMLHRGGEHRTVPKTALTDRNIEVQPLMNAFLQAGLGRLLRTSLRRVGINLSDQGRNRELARVAASSGNLATIDLSAASDTIAKRLVEFLLPSDWLTAMNICRTHRWKFRDAWLELERFSSMGNGFTFELECLIFWALCSATLEVSQVGGPLAVYGDDMILNVEAVELLSEVFQFAGFTINTKKSFVSGPFRESCGADWFKGTLITPHRLTNRIDTYPALVVAANGLMRASRSIGHDFAPDRPFIRASLRLRRLIHISLRRHLAVREDGDDVALIGRAKGGYFLHFKPEMSGDINWFSGRATALYRLWARRGPGEDHGRWEYLLRADEAALRRCFKQVRCAVTDETPLATLAGFTARLVSVSSGHVMNYWRDSGSWRLTD